MIVLLGAALASGGRAESVRVRVMAANLSSGRFQSYPNPGPGERIFRALQPDVVLIQEFNVNASSGGSNDSDAVDAWVDDIFGTDYHWFREPGGDQIPNGVISRWPIVESGEWRDTRVGNRDFAFARIDLPGERDLWAVSLHLLTSMASRRNGEARALVEAMADQPVPGADFVVVGGDLNTRNRGEAALETLSAVVDVLGPFPEDGGQPADGDTNSGRSRPYDWVLADGDLQAFSTSTLVGHLEFPDGLVFDSRVFTQEELDESFAPARTGDSAAPQMQHMAVVRDFMIPLEDEVEDADFTLSATRIDFGSVVAYEGPFTDGSIELRVVRPFSITAVAFDGSHPEEFEIGAPVPTLVEGDSRLEFTWSPAADDGEERRVVATVVIDTEPGAFEVELTGRPRVAAAEPIDLGGYRVEQSGGDASLTLPAGTLLPPGGLLVIGRAVDRAEFETFWGPLEEAVVYVNGLELANEPGFPIINGGETYRIVAADGAAVDPSVGMLPERPAAAGRSSQRAATDTDEFESRGDPATTATPGRFEGVVAATGRIVLTEIADAPGGGNYVFEFIELFYDAAPE